MKKTSLMISAALGILVLGAAFVFATFFTAVYSGEAPVILFLNGQETPAEVERQLDEAGVRTGGFGLLASVKSYRVRSGRYAVRQGDNLLAVFRRLRNGQQEPVNLTLPSVRTMDDLARFLGDHLMLPADTFALAFADSAFCARYGYTTATLPALFVPNTYQMYWNLSLADFMHRMERENAAFWNDGRQRKAENTGLTHEEIATLASIVDEETANNGEKPMVAGMYIKRLQIGMPLQADPTVKFALQEFGLRRILHKHLEVDNPYNTYKYEGLPPGPIRIASIAGIDAVLDYVRHDYIYMCAKEDFSGTHNFAATYAEHLRNAHRYAEALNRRNIH